MSKFKYKIFNKTKEKFKNELINFKDSIAWTFQSKKQILLEGKYDIGQDEIVTSAGALIGMLERNCIIANK